MLKYVLFLSTRKLRNKDYSKTYCTNENQDDSGWTPLMIASSVKDSDKVIDILLARGADVNQTSMTSHPPIHIQLPAF